MAKRGQGEGTISKRADGTWWARVTVGKDANGKQKRKAFYGKTRKEVQEKLTAAVNEVNNDVYLEPSKMTVTQWIDIWLKEYVYKKVKPKTYMNYDVSARLYVKPVLGEYRLKELRNDIVQRLANSIDSRGLSASTVASAIKVLKCALAQAVTNGLVKHNAAEGIRLPRKEKPEVRVLTVEQQERFVEVARTYDHGEMFILMLVTGLRIGECLALTWDDIDWDAAELSVNKNHVEVKDVYADSPRYEIQIGTPKTKAGIRTVPLTPKALQLLRQIKEQQEVHKRKMGAGYQDNDLLFCSGFGRPIWTNDMRKAFKRVMTKIGVDGLHIHCLRHTFATRGLENGIELKVMQEILGHASLSITADLYTHVLPHKKREAILKIDDTIKM